MPGGDRTGPWGAKAMSGRRAGFCAGYPVPGYMNPVGGRGFLGFGRGYGRGIGRGRGYRHMYWATGLPGWERPYSGDAGWDAGVAPFIGQPIPPQQEAEELKNQVSYLQNSIATLNQRIRELENLPEESEKE